MNDKIRVVVVEPNRQPEERLISNSLKELQRIVGGHIEVTILPETPEKVSGKPIVIICNEEGKLIGLPPNRDIGHDIICGTFIVAGAEGPELCSLDDDQVEYVKEVFAL